VPGDFLKAIEAIAEKIDEHPVSLIAEALKIWSFVIAALLYYEHI
jgi:hypothetical protein